MIASSFMTWESRERLSSYYMIDTLRTHSFCNTGVYCTYFHLRDMIEHNTDGMTIMLGMAHCPTYIWYTVCPQSPLGVLKNCGAQTNWASHMRFAADYGDVWIL
jgi:hypothetical protein